MSFTNYTLHLPSERQCISLVEPFVRAIPELQLLGPQRFHNMHVALTEAVNNAIIHAHNCQTDLLVHVDVQVSSTEVILLISDKGGGFNPDMLPDPRLPENLLREGGRGVFLIQHLADVVEFRPANPGMTVMIKYFLP